MLFNGRCCKVLLFVIFAADRVAGRQSPPKTSPRLPRERSGRPPGASKTVPGRPGAVASFAARPPHERSGRSGRSLSRAFASDLRCMAPFLSRFGSVSGPSGPWKILFFHLEGIAKSNFWPFSLPLSLPTPSGTSPRPSRDVPGASQDVPAVARALPKPG